MKANAVPQTQVSSGRRLWLALSLVGVGLLLGALFAGPAAAAAPGKNGQIQACYKVKGKAKGSVRVVPGNKKCKQGERKLAWSTSGAPGPQGAPGTVGSTGSTGSAGSPGSAGSSGSDASTASLETKIASLTTKVESLEGILAGVTNTGLTEAIGAVPAVNSLCAQVPTLTNSINSLGTSLDGASLIGIIPVGLGLDIPGLLPELPTFAC